MYAHGWVSMARFYVLIHFIAPSLSISNICDPYVHRCPLNALVH